MAAAAYIARQHSCRLLTTTMSAGHLHQQQPAAPTACRCCHAPTAPGLVAAEDWHLLFAAVCERLQASVAAAPPADLLAPVVLDAVQALHKLQKLLPAPRAAEPGLRAVPGTGKP